MWWPAPWNLWDLTASIFFRLRDLLPFVWSKGISIPFEGLIQKLFTLLMITSNWSKLGQVAASGCKGTREMMSLFCAQQISNLLLKKKGRIDIGKKLTTVGNIKFLCQLSSFLTYKSNGWCSSAELKLTLETSKLRTEQRTGVWTKV